MSRMATTIAKNLESTIKLNDGVIMPLFGLGMYKQGEHNSGTAEYALKNGYKMLDTAEFYKNESETGEAVRNCGLKRDEVFVVTKVWDGGYDNCKRAFSESHKKLNIGPVDLYLMHSPRDGQVIETYKAMLEFKEQGLARSIGVSNFGVQHLEGLKKAGLPTPSVNQIELHPWQRMEKIVQYCRDNGIAVMGWSPLVKGKKFDDPQLLELAKKYNKSPAQLLIRWSVQMGFITIPKSSKPERVIENAKVFDWSISEEDMKTMNSFPAFACAWDPTQSAFNG